MSELVAAQQISKKILIVEDDAVLSDSLKDHLSAKGYQVSVAGNGKIAQEMIRAWREDYWNAEEKRRDGIEFIREFIRTKAAPEALERRAVSWLYNQPNARLAPLNAAELKALVFSQMSAWCLSDR